MTYIFYSTLGRLGFFVLDVAIATWFVTFFDRNSSTDDCPKFLERIMKSFVSPKASKTFDKDIASNLDVLQQLFVIR